MEQATVAANLERARALWIECPMARRLESVADWRARPAS